MSGWMHLELNFKAIDFSKEAFPQKKPEGPYKELITYLNQVVNSVSGLINRYFFLFEDNPHLFLALEIINTDNFESIKDKINKIANPTFIDSYKIKFNTGDENHPEGTLDLFCASTKYAFFRITDDYSAGYNNNDEAKIIHCFCNQLFATWNNEAIFYLKGLFLRGALPFNMMVKNLQAMGLSQKEIIEFLLLDDPDNHKRLFLLMAFFIIGFQTDHITEFLKPMGISQESIIELLGPTEFPQEKIVEFSKLAFEIGKA